MFIIMSIAHLSLSSDLTVRHSVYIGGVVNFVGLFLMPTSSSMAIEDKYKIRVNSRVVGFVLTYSETRRKQIFVRNKQILNIHIDHLIPARDLFLATNSVACPLPIYIAYMPETEQYINQKRISAI